MGVLSARGWQWEACDRGRGVLPRLLGAARRRQGAPHPPLHPVLPAGVAVSHGPWCLCWALGRAGTLLLLSPAAFWVLGAAFFPLVFQALGRGEKDLGPLPLHGLRERLGRSGGELLACWGEDGAEHTSSESRAHTTRITPANPVTDLTYIWGRGGDMSAAADGVLKSLGSGRLRSCWPLALVRERMGCLLAEQPLQVESFLRLSGMGGILLTWGVTGFGSWTGDPLCWPRSTDQCCCLWPALL